MLEKLVLKHSLWVKMARGICKDPYLADDLVSEMYLKLKDYNKELKNSYIYCTIKHLYINYLREENKYSSLEDLDFAQEENIEKQKQEIPDCLTWVEKQILLLRQEHSGREIGKKYHIPFSKVHRIENKAKEKIKEWKSKELEM